MLHFLQKDPLGRVFLANAHTAFQGNKANIKIISNYLKSCHKIFKTTPPDNAKKLIESFLIIKTIFLSEPLSLA